MKKKEKIKEFLSNSTSTLPPCQPKKQGDVM